VGQQGPAAAAQPPGRSICPNALAHHESR
jgi:hypothetical protein